MKDGVRFLSIQCTSIVQGGLHKFWRSNIEVHRNESCNLTQISWSADVSVSEWKIWRICLQEQFVARDGLQTSTLVAVETPDCSRHTKIHIWELAQPGFRNFHGTFETMHVDFLLPVANYLHHHEAPSMDVDPRLISFRPHQVNNQWLVNFCYL